MTNQYQDKDINEGLTVLADGAPVSSNVSTLNFVGFQIQEPVNGEASVTSNGPTPPSIVTITSADSGMTLGAGATYFVNSDGGDLTLILPSAALGGDILVKNTGAGIVTIESGAGDNVDGDAVVELVNLNDAVEIISDNTSMWGVW